MCIAVEKVLFDTGPNMRNRGIAATIENRQEIERACGLRKTALQ